MESSVLLRAFAKVNYALEVRGLRDDGYHELSTVLQSISLSDEVEIERAGEGFALLVEPPEVEVGPPQANTAYRAWALLQETVGERLPVRVRLHKKIPSGAGLGGGSTDAAAVLTGMNALFDLGLGRGELRALASRIGADVAFCLEGGTALGEGRGDILSALPSPPDHRLVLLKPPEGASTAGVYRAYDARPTAVPAPARPVVEALESGDLQALAAAVSNGLAGVTASMVPAVEEYRERLLRAGAMGVAMSGTGTTVYGIFGSGDGLLPVVRELRAGFVYVAEPVRRGVELL